MQPDLLSVPHEEEKPQASIAQEAAQAEAPSTIEAQPEPVPTPTLPAEKKRSKSRLAVIALGVLVFLMLAAFAWVGYWAYQLSTDLTATQQKLVTLQSQHEELQADYNALSAENATLKADLEKANTDLSAAQAELTKLKDENKSIKAGIARAARLVEIIYIWTSSKDVTDILKIDSLVKESRDQQLISKWNQVTRSVSEGNVEEKFAEFIKYLITEAHNSLK